MSSLRSKKPLTRRQTEVLTLIRRGLSRAQIAEQMGISRHTVNDYFKAIYRYFDVHRREQLIRYFIKQSQEA